MEWYVILYQCLLLASCYFLIKIYRLRLQLRLFYRLSEFISQVNIAYIYCVNAMFYISGEVNSSGYEKIVASMIVLFIVFLDVILLKKLTEREAV